MRRKIKNISFTLLPAILFSLLPLTGCNKSAATTTLDQVAALTEEMPDSAISILNGIDTTNLTGGEYARLHLLKAEARYFSDVPDTTTAIISKATDYYIDHGTPEEAAKAFFLSGVVNENLGQYKPAMKALLLAEKFATEASDPYWLARIYRSMGDIFEKNHDWNSALSHQEKAYHMFVNADKPLHATDAVLDIARCQLMTGKYNLAISSAHKVMSSSDPDENPYLKSISLSIIAESEYFKKNYEAALATYNELFNDKRLNPHSQDYYYMGLTLSALEQFDKAQKCVEIMDSLGNHEHAILDFEIFMQGNQPNAAASNLLKELELNANEMDELRKTSLSNTILDFHEETDRLFKYEQKMERSFWISGIIVCIISLGAIWLFLRMRNNKLRTERDNIMLSVQNLTLSLDSKNNAFEESETKLLSTLEKLNATEEKLTGTSDRLINSERRLSEMEAEIKEKEAYFSHHKEIIRSLLCSQFDYINELAAIYNHSKDNEQEQMKILGKVRSLFNKLSTDAHSLSEIEIKVNSSTENIMKDFRKDFPSLNEWEYPLFLYYILGFTPTVISIFQKVDAKVIYKRKANLKKKISNSSSSRKLDYLFWLN